MADEQKVRVLRPDGRYSRIPVSSLSQAISAGYKLMGNPPSKPEIPKELRNTPASEMTEFPGRVLDRMGQNFKIMAETPSRMAESSRQEFLKKHPEGSQTALQKFAPSSLKDAITAMADSIVNEGVGALKGALKGVGSVSTPGIVGRMASGDKPENIAGDAAMFLMPESEEAGKLGHTQFDPTKAGPLRGSMTRGQAMMDRLDAAAKDIPVNWQPAYQWAQKAIELGKRGFTVPKPITDYVNWVDSRMKPGIDKISGKPNSFLDRGAEEHPLPYQHARDFEKSLGAKIPWEQDTGGVMNGIMKKMRESLGQETATALRPYGLEVPYLKAKADFTKAFRAERKWGPIGYLAGKLAGYGAGTLTGHPLIIGYAGGKAGEGAAGSMVRSIVNAGKK